MTTSAGELLRELRQTLRWMNALGGLGYQVHEKLEKSVAAIDAHLSQASDEVSDYMREYVEGHSLTALKAARKQASERADGVMGAWVIEREWKGKIKYYAGGWESDPNVATRFCRKEDAERLFKIFGFSERLGIKVAEHMWLSAAPAASVSADARNARRYEWLRAQGGKWSRITVVRWEPGNKDKDGTLLRESQLDTYIDAAMEKK